MASRGRGGAGAGRGRGRASLSFNVEQLGLAPGEMLPGPVLQPPPLYPPLEFRPAPLLQNPSYDSQLQRKNALLEHLNKSSAFVRLRQSSVEIGQFADAEQSKVTDKPFQMDWSCVPPEIKPTFTKRKRKSGSGSVLQNKVARKNIGNLTSWLEELEKKETAEETKETEEEDGDKKKEEDEQEAGEGEDVEEDEVDEEMDDGTDYNQNYFDSGEGYLDDEDDNLDDGPVY